MTYFQCGMLLCIFAAALTFLMVLGLYWYVVPAFVFTFGVGMTIVSVPDPIEEKGER